MKEPIGIGWKTIVSGAVAAAAGAAQIAFGVAIDADQQQTWAQIILGLVGILGGGGSIVFRIMAGLPTLRSAASEIARLKKQLAEAEAQKAVRASAPAVAS